jgi:hypothetical protein
LLWRRRAGDLALQHGEVALGLPDVEVDGVGGGVGRSRILVLGWLRLRRGWTRLLLRLSRHGLASDEGPDPSKSLDVLRRGPQPLEADLEHPRSSVLYLRGARPGTGPAEGWTTDADGLAGSDASGGIDARAVVASAPAERVLAMWS